MPHMITHYELWSNLNKDQAGIDELKTHTGQDDPSCLQTSITTLLAVEQKGDAR